MSRIVVISGPTGVGKSRTAMEIARRINGEIVNFDSVQIYRGFDIGSAKASREEQARVPHHLIDIVDATDDFDAAEFVRRAAPVCDHILDAGRTPILVGGTGFYIRALLGGLPDLPGKSVEIRERIRKIAERSRGPRWLWRMLQKVDSETAQRVSPRDRHRVERALEVWLSSGRPISTWNRPVTGSVRYDALRIALTIERVSLIPRLDVRVGEMFDAGLIDEVRGLLEKFPPTARPFSTIGYREAVQVVQGTLGIDDARKEASRRTRAYAKRQMTWLRGEKNVVWIDADREMSVIVEEILVAWDVGRGA